MTKHEIKEKIARNIHVVDFDGSKEHIDAHIDYAVSMAKQIIMENGSARKSRPISLFAEKVGANDQGILFGNEKSKIKKVLGYPDVDTTVQRILPEVLDHLKAALRREDLLARQNNQNTSFASLISEVVIFVENRSGRGVLMLRGADHRRMTRETDPMGLYTKDYLYEWVESNEKE
jgi:hypothetical protein